MFCINILLFLLATIPVFFPDPDSALAASNFFPAVFFFFLAGFAEYLGCCSILSWTAALIAAVFLVVIGGICLLIGFVKFEVEWNILHTISDPREKEEDPE